MSNKSVFGVVIMGFGVLWLLDNFRIINAPSLWEWIPIILIAFGVWRLVNSQFKSFIDSIILIVSGITIGLLQLDIITMRQILLAFWPVVVILIGMWFISSGKKKNFEKKGDKEDTKS
ncbi:MAG: hypothetical protein RLZZ223_668 [Candidatus Parcubacteria bacterium]|jgi:cytochrome c-type biogenesis protein CcmH/NrfF